MKKLFRYLGIAILLFGVLFATLYFIKTNSKSIVEYDTQAPYITSIERKTVVTGKVIPEDEVEIKPQIPGIIESLFVEEGDLVMNVRSSFFLGYSSITIIIKRIKLYLKKK